MRGYRLAVLLLVALAAGFGCSTESGSTLSAGGAPPDRSEELPEWQATLVPVSFEAWQQELRDLTGRIVVVDMWATWCLPCLERFPHMVQLAQRYSNQDVQFVSMCLDDRDDPDAIALARRFLTQQQAKFPNYLMDEVVTRAFDKLDLLGIPAVLIYGPEGDLQYRLTGDDPNQQFTDDDVDRAVAALLASR